MTALLWDEVGKRFYESGVDRGVLYLEDGSGVAWNGLISVDETVAGNEVSPVYYDGNKYADLVVAGDFAATISAYTYPDEFQQFEGVLSAGNGLFIANQPRPRFSLSYRTRIGSDEDDEEAYKIHVIYNLTAVPTQKSYKTLGDSVDPMTLQWSVTSLPSDTPGFRPSSHLIFDTREMSPLLLSDIENTLYGTAAKNASLPPLNFFVSYIGSWVIMRIVDNLDGTWTAIGPDEMIAMLDATTFQITQANATYLDADTYVIGDLTY